MDKNRQKTGKKKRMGKKTKTSWKPGISGNPNGRPKKNETITDIVKNTLRREVETREGRRQLRELFSQKVIEMALKGDIQAIKLIWNYDSGMPDKLIEHKIHKKVDINIEHSNERSAKILSILATAGAIESATEELNNTKTDKIHSSKAN
ncbi:hypothetical protein KY345_02125 [Candidatus Woesearchaeota archaeon]|nr:hypothetical protein [Candidatus Woesearchaeota archaeon]